MSTESNFILSGTSEWEDLGGGIQRKILGYSKELMLVKVKLEKGTTAPLHHHPHVQSSYIEEGELEVELGGEKKVLTQGDGFFVPSNVIHGVKAIETTIIIDAFNPFRQDFVEE